MKNKCYIAGDVGNLTVAEFEKTFAEAEEEVRAMGYEPVNPITLPHNHNKTWEAYLREDVVAMLGCTYVYACRNWRKSPGATIEIELALKLGINIIHQQPRREREEEFEV